MCNRYVAPAEADIERFWHIGRRAPWPDKREVYPRAPGPFIRPIADAKGEIEIVVGQWGLIPWFAKTPKLSYSTNNARSEELSDKASFKLPWQRGQRCIIPAWTFDEPCWETGKNVWFRFKRLDDRPWALAGIWNVWTDKGTGELFESYSMLTVNADSHPLMRRMHKPDATLPPDQQDKRSVVAIEAGDIDTWLLGKHDDATALLLPPSMDVIEGEPQGRQDSTHRITTTSRLSHVC
jgi:putative SOS response-associated peptidase YedK